MLKNYNPVIVFAFSKRECEGLALTLSKFEFNSADEQATVEKIFANAIAGLAPADRTLPRSKIYFHCSAEVSASTTGVCSPYSRK